MIVVTGTPRSGTSMLMQTLMLLGVPIVGDKFHDGNLPQNNPKGYWELPKTERVEGIKDHRYKGKGVKLMAQELLYTNPEFISKILFIIRYENYAVKSFQKCLIDNRLIKIKPNRNNAEILYRYALKCSEDYIKANSSIPCLKLDYKTILTNTENEIRRIRNFLDIGGNAKKAIKNIETDKRW